MDLGGFIGPVARALGGIDLAWVAGLLAAALSYLCFARAIRRSDLALGGVMAAART